jgi:hypothetical protein
MTEELRHTVPQSASLEDRLSRVEASQREQSGELRDQGVILKEHGRLLMQIRDAIVKDPMDPSKPGGFVGEMQKARTELDDHKDRIAALEAAKKGAHDRLWQVAAILGGSSGVVSTVIAWLRGHQ